MTTQDPSPRQLLRSNAALAVILLLGNLVFFGCVAGRHLTGPTDLSYPEAQSGRITVIGV